MSSILDKVLLFLDDASSGGVSPGIPPDLIEEFKEACGNALVRQFNSPKENRIRMSGVGKPLCQQKLDLDPKVKSEPDYTLIMKFLLGDIIEAIAIVIMKSAEVEIESEQEKVSLDIGGAKLSGTYDVKIDGKIYDIKSTSPASFASKFGANGGYFNIKNDDPFGYVLQGYLYSKAADCDFGGWIAINKSTGEWAVCEAPDIQDNDSKESLELASNNIKEITSKKKFKRGFLDKAETYKSKSGDIVSTGNKLLSKDCSFCGYKKHCWPKAVLHKKVTSGAKIQPLVWYSHLVKKEM